jgi:hypothetical protein
LEITFYIGDGISGTKFASFSKTTKGSGKSETKAYLMALKEINASDIQYTKFIDEGKLKIIEYYKSNADVIISEANALSSQNKFDEAIYKLVSVPNICKEAYDKCMNKIPEIYKAKMERECQKLIAESKVLIAQDDYNKAAKVLSPLLPDLSCYPEVAILVQQISDHKCAILLAEAQGAWANKDINATSTALSKIPADSKYHEDAVKLADEFCTHYLSEAKAAWANSDITKASEALAKINSGSKCNADAEKITEEFCTVYLGKARGAWAGKNIESTSEYLMKVRSGTKCYSEALVLGEEVKKWVKEKDGRDWDLAKEKDKREFDLRAKEQQDNSDFAKNEQQNNSEQAKREYELRSREQKDNTELAKLRIPGDLQKQKNEMELSKLRIQKSQEIGLAYASTMAKVAYNTSGW